MNVKELIEFLQTQSPDTQVYEDNCGVLRSLPDYDVGVIDFDPESEFKDDEGNIIVGKVVVFGAFG